MLSLKQIGTICFVFSLILISQKSYSDIAANNSNPSCDNSTLNTYTGPAALEAKWNANIIQLKWYKDNEQLDVQDAADQCTYDGTMILPTNRPTKTGYDFNGWKVKTAQSPFICGIQVSDIESFFGEVNYFVTGSDGNGGMVCVGGTGNTEAQDCSTAPFNTMGVNGWIIESGTTTIKGIASCNNTQGASAEVRDAFEQSAEAQMEAGTMTEIDYLAQYANLPGMTQSSNTFNTTSTGRYCWCKVTSVTKNGGQQCDATSANWVSFTDLETASNCSGTCAGACAIYGGWIAPLVNPSL